MTNLIKTKDKVISCVSGESTKEFEETKKEFEKAVGNIVQGGAEKLMVLAGVLRELPKLSGRHKWIRFNFGNKKEWELKRTK